LKSQKLEIDMLMFPAPVAVLAVDDFRASHRTVRESLPSYGSCYCL